MNSASTHASITRRKLYQLVWAEPMIKVAEYFGISDVGMAKICRKYDIPRPPRGYWAKVQHGQKPAQIQLPKSDHDEDIEIRDPSHASPSGSALLDDGQREGAAERQVEKRIAVAETLRGSHELVSKANQELQAERADRHGMIQRPNKPTLDIIVSKASLRRALLIMDALFQALEKRGYQVSAGPKVTILGVDVSFGISESLETVGESCKEHNLDGDYVFGHSRYNEKCSPSGKLTLKINEGGAYWTNRTRHNWCDTEKKPLEDRLNQFVAGLVEMAARLKCRDEELAKQAELQRQQEARLQEEARQRAERRNAYRAEKARVDLLLTQAENWQRSKLLRDLIDAAARPTPPMVPLSQAAVSRIGSNGPLRKPIAWTR